MSAAIVNEINVTETRETTREIFALVEASQLSLDDEFMAHTPRTADEKELKRLLIKAIKQGLNDFYRPILDPSFNDEGGICYVPGNEPGINQTFNWWKETVKNFMPERNSRLGTINEYVAFLGVIMKRLVAIGWNVSKVWDAVCNDSIKLGHYWNSPSNYQCLEPTGSSEVAGFFDLSNTMKILTKGKENDQIWLASGFYGCYSYEFCLSELYNQISRTIILDNCVGWIILEK